MALDTREGNEGGDMEILTAQERVSVLEQSRMPPRLAKRGVYAFLDLEHADGSSDRSQAAGSSETRYSDVPILYLHQRQPAEIGISIPPGLAEGRANSESDSVGTDAEVSVPLFKLNNRFLGSSSQQVGQLLDRALHFSKDAQEERQQAETTTTIMIALCSSASSKDDYTRNGVPPEMKSHNVPCDAEPVERGDSASGIPLFIALWRLRLWNGMGWTVPDPVDATSTMATAAVGKKLKGSINMGRGGHKNEAETEDAGLKAREQAAGQVVQGFNLVQGVMHAKWM